MAQGMVLKDKARTDLARSAFRMTSILSLSTGRSAELPVQTETKVQSTTDLTAEDQRLTPLGAFLVDEDYRQSVIGSAKRVVMAPFNTTAQLVDQVIDSVQDLQYRIHEHLIAAPARKFNQALAATWQRIVPKRKQKATEQFEEEGAVSIGHPPVSFVDLYEMNVLFTDNYGLPLYDFRTNRNKYGFSKAVVDPLATQNALEAIRECADRATNLPTPEEGTYAGIPLPNVLGEAQEEDLQAFLHYVSAYPGNYIGRNLKVSETFATWVIYGAPGAED